MNRRNFLKTTSAAAAVAGADPGGASTGQFPAIDFRYAPLSWQTAYCFPDDHYKSLIGERGELRYGNPGRGKQTDYFPVIVEFSMHGMEQGLVVSQQLEAPGVPIIHTLIERLEVYLELITFATNREGEGRVDNVIVEVRPRTATRVHLYPILVLKTPKEVTVRREGDVTQLQLGPGSSPLFAATSAPLGKHDNGQGGLYILPEGVASAGKPLRHFFRFPQEGQSIERIKAGLAAPDGMLAEARDYWQGWQAAGGEVKWSLAGRHHEFLVACARNIQQAREVQNGKLTFQVGPTCYRGLWVVDGHFILEAARYLGYDAEAQQGLETTWSRQEPEGIVYASAGREHWKDTGIAMFSMVRQAELAQDWSYFRRMQPNLLRAVKFLRDLRDNGRNDGSPNGRYGLLPPGFGDGGLGGIRPEFTNTLWVLAGLKAVAEAAERQRISGFDETRQFHDELRAAFRAAAKEEMRRHAGGFVYLPMLMKTDPLWTVADDWGKPRPQVGQWALSHAIYPGMVFDKNDPVVLGHLALMQSCTQEDIPAETGWIHHDGVWNYNAAFVAHAYLWAGLPDWARLTFTGFLNHASPLYCWREEQPLRGSLAAGYVGDMPHNWASAECVLYLRHMLALEDGAALRLLEGIGDPELDMGEPYTVIASPTRFGRVTVSLEPAARGRTWSWSLRFERAKGPTPASVRLPARLGSRLALDSVSVATFRGEGDTVLVTPEATSWSATWVRKV